NLALYDCAKRLLLSRISGAHEREVTAVAASPSQLCASGSRDKSLRFWRVDAPSEGSNLNLEPAGDLPDAHELVVSAVDFNSLDGSQLVTGSRDNTVKLWDAVAQQQISSAVVSRNLVTHIRWVPNSHQFLQSGEDKELKLWDSRPLKVVGTFSRKQYIQTCCDVRQDGDQCVSSSNGFGGNGCEATWDPTVGRETAILPVEGAGPIACVRPLPQVANGLIGAATFNRGVCLCSVGSDSLSLSHRY
uniref:WD_REPEATS_REGION domain-containing protein n=1 Tax=Macrostomum lignano TaxID=282301 RepID=A0A1I8HRX8_9PLAT